MSNKLKKLNELKEAYEESKESRAKIKGQIEAMEKEFEDKYDTTDIEELKAKVTKWEKKCDKMDIELEKAIKEIEEQLDASKSN